jgi:Trk K+ transport system NAD-binding subunit
MKFLPSQLMYLLGEREMQRNLRALFSFLAALAASMVAFTVIFHVLMVYEGQEHSWITGMYWTLTVMSTLGFGDITFHSDLGRLFSIFVLLYGIVMLLIVLPFTFIRFFYAPWLEAQVRLRAPRSVPDDMRDHVVICHNDELARALIVRLDRLEVPYVVLEGDTTKAADLHLEGISVVAGAADANQTFEAVRVQDARLVVANLGDAANTNITLTVREIAPDVPVVAFAEGIDSVDVLEFSGATEVVPLKQRLGAQLASRVAAGLQTAHRIGSFEGLSIAEVPIHGTSLPGRTIRDTRLRELTGLNIVAVWERGKLLPAGPETLLSEQSVPVVVGTEDQITELDALFIIYHPVDAPALVIGGGNVGKAACIALRKRESPVTVLDSDETLEPALSQLADRVVIGDASNLETVKLAGIEDATSVVLTTNDDATNIFLTLYCRRLNPDAHIVSRITHEWNLEAIHRAGADFALSHGSLGIQTLLSMIQGRELIVVGEGTELFVEPIPPSLAGKALASSAIGAETGLNVIAIRDNGSLLTNPPASTLLPADGELVMLGTSEQRQGFLKLGAS